MQIRAGQWQVARGDEPAGLQATQDGLVDVGSQALSCRTDTSSGRPLLAGTTSSRSEPIADPRRGTSWAVCHGGSDPNFPTQC